ncbi:hypothetical protein OAM67_00715 [bacterium]|nr:hypothetical protein [bacterium]
MTSLLAFVANLRSNFMDVCDVAAAEGIATYLTHRAVEKKINDFVRKLVPQFPLLDWDCVKAKHLLSTQQWSGSKYQSLCQMLQQDSCEGVLAFHTRFSISGRRRVPRFPTQCTMKVRSSLWSSTRFVPIVCDCHMCLFDQSTNTLYDPNASSIEPGRTEQLAVNLQRLCGVPHVRVVFTALQRYRDCTVWCSILALCFERGVSLQTIQQHQENIFAAFCASVFGRRVHEGVGNSRICRLLTKLKRGKSTKSAKSAKSAKSTTRNAKA